MLLLLVFLYRSLVQGELPKAISGRGAEWTDLGAASRATFRELEMEVDDLRSAIQELREALAMEG